MLARKKLALLGIFILAIIFLPGYSRLQELKAKNKLLLTEIEGLTKENTQLARQIERLEKDPVYIEKKARDKMGIGRKGEIKYKVVRTSKESNE